MTPRKEGTLTGIPETHGIDPLQRAHSGPAEVRPLSIRPSAALGRLRGRASIFFAFDIGQWIDLEKARRQLESPSEDARIKGSRRAPRYFQFNPLPVRVSRSVPPVTFGAFVTDPGIDVTLYDFGGVSVAFTLPFDTTSDHLIELASALSDSDRLPELARAEVARVLEQTRESVTRPALSDLVEDYLVFQIDALDPPVRPDELCVRYRGELARILRSEPEPLSEDEIADATSVHISYGKEDVALLDWNAALLFDTEADDSRAILEFANMELLEMRFLDGQLDDSLDRAYEALGGAGPRAPGLGRSGLARVGRMQVDAAILFERVNNALKLIGDPYLARVYRLASQRFRVSEWNAGILRKVEALESIYEKMSDRATTTRQEVLEWIIIGLIAVEMLLPWIKSLLPHS
jgi:hypothetical protein